MSKHNRANPVDWHKADIVAALHKSGTSLRKLSIENNYHPDALKHALHRPWPHGELVIAQRLGIDVSMIWPSRYDNGKPNRKRGRPKVSTLKENFNTSGQASTTKAKNTLQVHAA